MDLIINIFVVIIGLVIGIIIGYFIFKEYKYKGPDSNIISQEIYVDSNGLEYKFVPKVCICPINMSMSKLKDPNYIDPDH